MSETGDAVTLDVGAKAALVVKCGDIRSEKADGAVFPINTAFAVGGSSADVMIAVDQARMRQRPLTKTSTYDFLFPALRIPNPLELAPGTVILDLEDRPRVAALGTAVASEPLRAAGLLLPQQWDRVIAAFIRHQGEQAADESISSAAFQALAEAERCRLASIAMVPFAAGFGGVSPERSAALMMQALLRFFRTRESSRLEKITILMFNEVLFDRFAGAAREAA